MERLLDWHISNFPLYIFYFPIFLFTNRPKCIGWRGSAKRYVDSPMERLLDWHISNFSLFIIYFPIFLFTNKPKCIKWSEREAQTAASGEVARSATSTRQCNDYWTGILTIFHCS